MTRPSRNRDRIQLERELETDAYRGLLHLLGGREPFYHRFKTWAEVLSFMSRGENGCQDEVLRPILQAHSEDGDPRWRAILLGIFWPRLESIRFRRRRWDTDLGDLWQNIVWAFLRVSCRIDGQRRSDHLVRKLLNDTTRCLGDRYRTIWRTAEVELPVRRNELEAVADLRGVDLAGIERRAQQAAELKRLQEHLLAGHITEGDFLLLLGTRVYGKRLADYVRESGLDYQVTKKRRQRAEAAISRMEQEMHESQHRMSPPQGFHPPLCSRDECND